MIKKLFYLGLFASIFLFVQCKKEPLQTQVTVHHLSDYESNDGSVNLTISGGKQPYKVLWSNKSSDTVLSNLAAGIYYVTITDAKKTILKDTVVINQPPWPVCVDNQGNNYKTRIIGNQIWMVENLRVTTSPKGDSIHSYIWNDSLSVIQKYGLLYTWDQAMNHSTVKGAQGICPDGWHIPTDGDWEMLVDNISTADKEIPNLVKELSLTFPGFYNNGFQNKDASVSFWTSTEAGNNAWKRYFHKSLSKAFRYHETKQNAISVRCVKNSKAES